MKKPKLSLTAKSIDFKAFSPKFRITSNKFPLPDPFLTPQNAYFSFSEEIPPGNCRIILSIGPKKLRFHLNISNQTSSGLVRAILSRHPESRTCILGLTLRGKYPLIDYVLSQKEENIDFLRDLILEFEAFYQEIKPKGVRFSLKHFHFVRKIGSGGFSQVYLARSKISGVFHAVKLIDRDFIRKNQKEGIVNNERRVLAALDSPYLIRLDYAFKTTKYLVFVMEFCAGGELFHHLRLLKRFSEDQARTCFLEMCLGVKYLHEKNIIYRDIKPENILVSYDGHIKIADFGLAKPDMNRVKRATS